MQGLTLETAALSEHGMQSWKLPNTQLPQTRTVDTKAMQLLEHLQKEKLPAEGLRGCLHVGKCEASKVSAAGSP